MCWQLSNMPYLKNGHSNTAAHTIKKPRRVRTHLAFWLLFFESCSNKTHPFEDYHDLMWQKDVSFTISDALFSSTKTIIPFTISDVLFQKTPFPFTISDVLFSSKIMQWPNGGRKKHHLQCNLCKTRIQHARLCRPAHFYMSDCILFTIFLEHCNQRNQRAKNFQLHCPRLTQCNYFHNKEQLPTLYAACEACMMGTISEVRGNHLSRRA